MKEEGVQNNNISKKKILLLVYHPVATGFEPVQAGPNGFQVHLLNHSDKRPKSILTFKIRILAKVNRTPDQRKPMNKPLQSVALPSELSRVVYSIYSGIEPLFVEYRSTVLPID